MDDRITYARAEGTSDSSGNPSAFVYSRSVLEDGSYRDVQDALSAGGFDDAYSPSTVYILQHVSREHLRPYLAHIQKSEGVLPPLVKCAHDVLLFDRRFESIALKHIGSIELQMKAQYSHWAHLDQDPFFLYDQEMFFDEAKYRTAMQGYEREVKRKIKKDRRLRDLYRTHENRLPIDAGVECMTLGTLSRFFDNTKNLPITNAVSASFDASKAELSSWMKAISDVRNVCAHFDSLLTRTQIPSPPLKIRGLDGDNTKPFYIAVLIVRLLAREELFEDMNLCYPYVFAGELYKLLDSFERYLSGSLATFGIPKNWIEILNAASGGQIYKAVEYLEGKSD